MLAFLERLTEATSIEDVWQLLLETMDGYDFDRLLYGFTRFRTPNGFGNREDLLVLSNHSQEYVRPFMDEKLFFDAPMVRWSLENTGACSWGWMTRSPEKLSEGERRVLEFNKAHGVIAGYSISFPDLSRRTKGAIGLTARDGMTQADADAIWAKHGREIIAMCNMAHLKLVSLPHWGGRKTLTPRQREVLEWVGDGKTSADIAIIMGLTQATVEKHLRLARESLDVETTAQAVLKAAVQNQMFGIEGKN